MGLAADKLSTAVKLLHVVRFFAAAAIAFVTEALLINALPVKRPLTTVEPNLRKTTSTISPLQHSSGWSDLPEVAAILAPIKPCLRSSHGNNLFFPRSPALGGSITDSVAITSIQAASAVASRSAKSDGSNQSCPASPLSQPPAFGAHSKRR